MNFHKIHHYVDLERNHHLFSYSIFFNLSYEQHQNDKNSQDSQGILKFSNFPTYEFQNCAKSWLLHMKLNCVTLNRKLFPIDSLDVFHTSSLLFFIYCSYMFTMFVFHFYDTREEKRGFQGFFIWSIFITWSPNACFDSLMRFWFNIHESFWILFIFSHLCCII